MNKKHRYVDLHQISPGEILADDLLDKLGHVLLPAGTELTASMLKAIANHDIHQLPLHYVTDPDSVEPQREDTDSIEQQLNRVNHLFRHSPREGATETLRNYVESYRRGDA
ncbi:hypothetical protein [Undibacterium macrobrachii]|jgi:hypothetical protein|uniref:Uncharacterized protein n=1 Tax=Undibacterium macrobrachii TaxID=1119058 RepID=A0ABQ2X8X1_9BURK|nr:hypothetical protein [Undibacterium macrobrachii]GGX04139.1 hypothetical protein GCM10011282_07890 [Undibacterium macrobrachii]